MNLLINEIDFGGEKYSVTYIDKLLDVDRSTKLSGSITHNSCTIELEKGLCPQRLVEVLVHECVHYWLITYGYNNPGSVNPDRKEGLINTLSMGIVTLIKRNPNLIRVIQEQV